MDPSGMEKKEIGGNWFDLPDFGFLTIISRLFGPNSKEQCLKDVPFYREGDLPKLPPGIEPTRCGGARGWAGVIPKGGYIGPSGCNTCVGVVLIPPEPTMETYVFHITPNNDSQKCLESSGLLELKSDGDRLGACIYWNAPPGYKAILCGSEGIPNNKEYDCERLHVLNEVKKCLSLHGI